MEPLGGFRNLQFDENDVFRSPLGINGTVSWHKLASNPTSTDGSSSVKLTVGFPEVEWSSLRSVYGWAALQYQGWARGHLEVRGASPCRITLFTDNVLEVWVNNKQFYGGDFYAFRRAPLVVTLRPGGNVIDVRLIREIRSMGGADSSVTVNLEAQVSTDTLRFVEATAILPDLVDGKLPSGSASITVRNEGEDWMELCDCDMESVPTTRYSLNTSPSLPVPPAAQTGATNPKDKPIRIAPGQSRPIVFHIEMDDCESNRVTKTFAFRKSGVDSMRKIETLNFELTRRSLSEPHKMTFLHPSGTVSYAILRPPSDIGKKGGSETALPVLLNLHGAGLEADSHQVRHMLDSVPDVRAWTLFPTGMSPWSGDDWHTWGFADVRAAILAISDWIENVSWDGPGVLTYKWFVSGHSNGGQGTWHFMGHHPDHILGAAAVSGYSSIEAYVPYSMWREAHPLLTAVVHQAIASCSHELLVENMAQTPTMIQHGSDDDNVPPYHSRLMNSLLGETDAEASYVELPNKGHWFEGAMATAALRTFYHQHLSSLVNTGQPPETFSAVFPDSDDMGPRFGIVVDQLESPDHFGRIDVSRNDQMWRLSTTNIHRLHFDFTVRGVKPPVTILLDGSEMACAGMSYSRLATSFVQSKNCSWDVEVTEKWKTLGQRLGRQRGALDAVMRTTGSFKITRCSENTFDIALQISRNLYQYYHADSTITNYPNQDVNQAGNSITLAMGRDLPPAELAAFPIDILPTGIQLHKRGRSRVKFIPMEAGLGAIFLRPLRNEQLELVVWGADESGLRQAARLVPTLTGVGQADFIILSRTAAWQGHAGAVSMGFLDFEWQISEGSFL